MHLVSLIELCGPVVYSRATPCGWPAWPSHGLKLTPMGVALLYTMHLVSLIELCGPVVYSRATPCGWPAPCGWPRRVACPLRVAPAGGLHTGMACTPP